MTIKLKTTNKHLTLNIKNPEEIESFVKNEKTGNIEAIEYKGKLYDIESLPEEEFLTICPQFKNK